MIKIELELTDIEYDALLDAYLPQLQGKLGESGSPLARLLAGGAPASLARAALSRAPQSAKDKLAAELLNANAEKLKGELTRFAAENGIRGRIAAFRARAE